VPELLLGPMLRHVGPTSATVWVETDGPADVTVLGHTSHTFHVAGHHYALVIVNDLSPGSCVEYDVQLDGIVRWPVEDSTYPPSVIRTIGDGPVHVLFGSCRTAAPHEPPYTLELALDPTGRGVDALRTHALRMMTQRPDEWPHIALMLGDQVYADDSSPRTHERIAEKRAATPIDGIPPEIVHGFEEYCWLYHESWSPAVERWFFSVVPTAMIFDDHDMVDDWNISATWVAEIRQQPWWETHIIGGLTTYWLYQHLGNLSPDEIETEGMLAALQRADDGAELLGAWARESERSTPVPGGYRFSFARRLGDVTIVIVDSRNGRVLDPAARSMVDPDEWEWISERCREPAAHLVIGTSLPAFTPGGIGDLQQWNERICAGAWSRFAMKAGERLRRALDLEDWPAFARSFDALIALVAEVGASDRTGAPATISVLSGDIHFSYHAELHFPPGSDVRSRVHQIVNSPMRNALRPHERTAMRVVMSRPGAALLRGLRRASGGRRPAVRWGLDHGPVFDNCIGELRFDGASASVRLERATNDADRDQPRLDVVFEVDLAN
jgi:hypothetical protein